MSLGGSDHPETEKISLQPLKVTTLLVACTSCLCKDLKSLAENSIVALAATSVFYSVVVYHDK